MLRPLLDDDLPAAAALLAEGFPERPAGFWIQGLADLRRHGGNAAAGVPLGTLMLDRAGSPVGVILTPASLRQRAGQPAQRLVNVSSWYIRPEHRWRAGPMLRQVTADPESVYIDLTPTPDVQRMLLAFGFRAVNRGTTLAVLPLLALRPDPGARVRAVTQADRLSISDPPLDMVLDHRHMGCEPLLLEHPGGRTLLVYRRRPVRGLPAARLKYVGSHAVLQRHLPTLARHLLARGLPLLSFDTREAPAPGPAFVHRPGGVWFAKGGTFDDCTDFIGTELSILGV